MAQTQALAQQAARQRQVQAALRASVRLGKALRGRAQRKLQLGKARLGTAQQGKVAVVQ